MSLKQMLDSGEVRRYHTHPLLARFGQPDSEHQWRCVIIILMLHPNPSKSLLVAAATHDCGELGAGDLAFLFKRNHPELAAEHKRIEEDMARDMGRPMVALSTDEMRWLGLADRLESTLYAKQMLGALPEDWERNNDEVYRDAAALGIEEQVKEIING